MDWNEGYVTETVYTSGFYADFNPVKTPFLFALTGITPPNIKTACELGYGQGVSLNIYAAAEQVAWWGTDFNPAQAENAQQMALASGAKAYCHADSFRDFCERDDLPEFDYIALHGIWSWISRENQDEIVHLIDKKLKIGGALYISYNTLPGWSPLIPAREMMMAYVRSACARGNGIVVNMDHALEFMDKLMAIEPRYSSAVPQLKDKLETLKKQNHAYLVHEFLNEAWDTVTFGQMAAILKGARMEYACSAQFLDNFDTVGVSQEQAQFLSTITDPTLRQMARDFIRNTQFRKDFWIKGKLPLTPRDRADYMRKTQFVLVKPDATKEIKCQLGSITISEQAFNAIMEVLADLKPHGLAEIERSGQKVSQSLSVLLTPLCAMLDAGIIQIAQKKEDVAKSRATCDKLNMFLENRALGNAETNFLASPLTGGGYAVGRFSQIFLNGMRKGYKTTDELARYLWDILRENGERVTREGKPLATEEETMPVLLEKAQQFTASLPVLRALMIA